MDISLCKEFYVVGGDGHLALNAGSCLDCAGLDHCWDCLFISFDHLMVFVCDNCDFLSIVGNLRDGLTSDFLDHNLSGYLILNFSVFGFHSLNNSLKMGVSLNNITVCLLSNHNFPDNLLNNGLFNFLSDINDFLTDDFNFGGIIGL